MDEKANKKPVEAATKKAAEYEFSSLREHSRELFGVSTSTFDGATNGLDRNGKYTKNEIKAIIEKWEKTPVFAGKESK